jgi:hypothetical protein
MYMFMKHCFRSVRQTVLAAAGFSVNLALTAVLFALLQRLGMLDMPDLDHIGGHVEGLTAVITGPTR